MKLVFSFLLLIFTGNYTFAQSKIAVVDMEYLISEHPYSKPFEYIYNIFSQKLSDSLEVYQVMYNREVEWLRTEFYIPDSISADSITKAEYVQGFELKLLDIQDAASSYYAYAQDTLQKLGIYHSSIINEHIGKILEEFILKTDYSLVLDQKQLLYFKKEDDLTDSIYQQIKGDNTNLEFK